MNYLNCLLQKAVKDRVPLNSCDLELILWYHLECPDYAKKFDDPKHEKYLKRQMFNLLTVPYMSMRMSEMNAKNKKESVISDFEKKRKFIEYPEEIKPIEKTASQKLEDLLKDKNLREKFFEGVEYQKDPSEETD